MKASKNISFLVFLFAVVCAIPIPEQVEEQITEKGLETIEETRTATTTSSTLTTKGVNPVKETLDPIGFTTLCPSTCYIHGTFGIFRQLWMGNVDLKHSSAYDVLLNRLEDTLSKGLRPSLLQKFGPRVRVINVNPTSGADKALEVEYYMLLTRVNMVLTTERLMEHLYSVIKAVNTTFTIRSPQESSYSLYIISSVQRAEVIAGIFFDNSETESPPVPWYQILAIFVLVTGLVIAVLLASFVCSPSCCDRKRFRSGGGQNVWAIGTVAIHMEMIEEQAKAGNPYVLSMRRLPTKRSWDSSTLASSNNVYDLLPKTAKKVNGQTSLTSSSNVVESPRRHSPNTTSPNDTLPPVSQPVASASRKKMHR